MLVVPEDHALAQRETDQLLKKCWTGTSWACTGGSSISLAMRGAAARSGHPLHQRIQVTSLDAMCRMIDNGLGVGLIPDRAFELMHGVGHLRAVPLTDAWAAAHR